MKLTIVLPIFITMIAILIVSGCIDAPSTGIIQPTEIPFIYSPTPTPVPATIIPTPVPTPYVPITMAFTVLTTENAGYKIITTDNKILYIEDSDHWNEIMPNQIYACSIGEKISNNSYAVSDCKKYMYQNPTYVIYPTETVNRYQYSGNVEYYHYNGQYVECTNGVCKPYYPVQIPPSVRVKEQFPPYTIFV